MFAHIVFELTFELLIFYAFCRHWFMWKMWKLFWQFWNQFKFNFSFLLDLFPEAQFYFFFKPQKYQQTASVSWFIWTNYFSPTAETFQLIWWYLYETFVSWQNFVFRWTKVWEDITSTDFVINRKIVIL